MRVDSIETCPAWACTPATGRPRFITRSMAKTLAGDRRNAGDAEQWAAAIAADLEMRARPQARPAAPA
jgi:hypothetical protein